MIRCDTLVFLYSRDSLCAFQVKILTFYSLFCTIQTAMEKANRTIAVKMTNDLLHGLLSTEYMANHSLAGGNKEKEALPVGVVDAVVCNSLHVFTIGGQH